MTEKDSLQPTAEPIYEALKAAIMAGTLAPGEPLRQDDIARQHGVSKIPVREALLRLEVDGFVLFRKNKGATVRELSATEVLNLLDIRVALECRALELAIPQMAESDLERVRQLLNDYDRETRHEGWSTLNTLLHEALYEPCGNEPLLQMIRDVRARLGPAVRLLVSETTGLKRPQGEHRQILAACEAGDVPRAVHLLRRHIETTRKETAARLRRQGLV
jgi:DNA-binding GntR family transcriptional regulator